MSKYCPICRVRYPDEAATCRTCGMRLFSRRDPLVGRVVDGRYEVGERIGAGGMATVYRADDLREERTVALKVLAGELAAQPVQRLRFLREARAAGRVRHANVVEVYELGEDGDLVFMVMELLEGRTLGEELAAGRFTVRRALEVELALLAGLAHAHALDVVHRDVKPDNVVLARGASGALRLKILDFGLARIKGDLRLTKTGQVFGTPEYISPEQATGEPASPASDQYAAGVILYEMLTGRPPFVGPAPQVLTAHFKTPPRPLGEVVRGEIPPAVEAIALRMLAKRPRDRFPDLGSLAAALGEELAALGEELAALPPEAGR